MERRIRYEE